MDSTTRPDNTIAQLRVYRCRRCASTFNDDDWQLRCSAPPARIGRKSRAQEPLKYETLDEAPEYARNALEEVLRKRGMK